MYYFIEILYLITAVTSLKINIGGDVYLNPEGETHYKVKAETEHKEESSDERQHGRSLSKELQASTTSVDSSELSSDDGSKEIPVTTTTERTTIKKQKKKRNSIRTTSFTTKYERGTTRRYKDSLRGRHHHRHRDGKKVKTVLENVHGYTLPTWPTTPDFGLKSEELPTIQSDTAVVDGQHHHHHHVNDWLEEINNKNKELTNMFNDITNQPNTWSEAIKYQTQQFGDNLNQFTDQTETAPIDEVFHLFNDHLDKMIHMLENKTHQMAENISAIGTEANKAKERIEDKIQEYNKDLQNWQDHFHNFGDKINEFGNEANKWHDHAIDKQKEIEDKFYEFGNQVNKLHEKKEELLNETNGFANQTLDWHIDVINKTKGFVDKYNEAAEQAHHLQQQLNNHVNDSYHKIKDNLSIAAFTEHILTRTLRLFDKVKKESDEYYWRKKFKHLAKNYEDKFKEFLRTTGHQQIKTILGPQNVVLNAIDMSKHIVNRLVNIMIHETDKKGLRTRHTQEIFATEIRKEVAAQMKHACLTLGVCLTHSVFTQTVTDLLTHMLMLDDEKFKQAFDSFTEAAKNTDFSRSLGDRRDRRLKRKIALVEDKDVSLQRPMVLIINNIVTNRNKPIVMTEDIDPEECNLNVTLAFLEVIDTLDKNVPDSDINVKNLNDIRTGMREWAEGYNIQDTMTNFVSLIRSVLDEMNGKAYHAIRHSADILFD